MISDFSGKLHMYYVRFKNLITHSIDNLLLLFYSIGNPSSSLLINDVIQLFLLRLTKNLIKNYSF